MFKLEKPQLETIHSGHFMVSRLDDDEENNNNGDDISEQDEENASSVEFYNPTKAIEDINYRVENAISKTKNENLTSWNDLDRPQSKPQQYIVYYANRDQSYDSIGDINPSATSRVAATLSSTAANVQNQIYESPATSGACVGSDSSGILPRKKQELIRSMSLDHSSKAQMLHKHSRSDRNGNNLQYNNLNSHQYNQHHPTASATTSSSFMSMQTSLQQINNANQVPNQPLVFIDATLTKLLECMSLYYSSKLTSPKWKSFKGSNLRLKKKIRLNNLIWRAWFLQYIRGRRPPGCQFITATDPDVHKKSETIVLEGKYWKRKVDAIVHEYHKWRQFHKHKKIQMNCFRPSSFDWDSRVHNLTSTTCTSNLYQDLDVNNPYSIDDLPPMLEDIEGREDIYYTPLTPSLSQTSAALALSSSMSNTNPITTSTNATQSSTPVNVTTSSVPAGNLINTASVTATALAAVQKHESQLMHAAQSPNKFATQTHRPYANQANQPQQVPQHQPQHIQQHWSQQLSSRNQCMPAYSPSSSVGTEMQIGGLRNEQKRVFHINAEQKRRCNIKNGFDTLKSILPSINQNVSFKISKAAMLQKAAQHIQVLSAKHDQQINEATMLRKKIENLKEEISTYQSQLPASGLRVGCQNYNKAKEMFDDYIRKRTLENWRFWIFSLFIEPLFNSYYNSVSTATLEDAFRTIIIWLNQSCNLMSLRKNALESMTFLSTSTNILNRPSTFPNEALEAVNYKQQQRSPTASSSFNTAIGPQTRLALLNQQVASSAASATLSAQGLNNTMIANCIPPVTHQTQPLPHQQQPPQLAQHPPNVLSASQPGGAMYARDVQVFQQVTNMNANRWHP